MNTKIKFKILTVFSIFIFLLISEKAGAQFYNGHQMTFGKNRVQYNDYDWQYLRFEDFDIYYNQNGKELAKYTSEYVTEILPEIENFFGYVLQERIIFLVYNNLSDFRQSNIGLETGSVQFNIGGVTQISDNKVFLYYETDHVKYKTQIKRAIAQVILTEMIYGDDFKEKVTNSTLLTLPEWYEKGLISYVSTEWNFEIENKVKDGITSGKYDKINHLTGDDAEIAGHSIWYYIAEEYGKDVISNIIYLTRVNKNVDSGLMYVLGTSIKNLTPLWLDYYTQKFSNTSDYQSEIGDKIIEKPKANTIYQQLKINPTADKIAFLTNTYGKYKIFIYDLTTNELLKILKVGHKLQQINDYTYPVIEWHPTGKILSYIIETEGNIVFYQYFIETEELKERNIIEFTKIISYSYSEDGKKIILSAVKDGYTDIFELNIAGGVSTRITYDLADDLNPKYLKNSSEIVFASNRISDTLEVEKFENHGNISSDFDIFLHNPDNNPEILTRITSTPYSSETNPNQISENTYSYLSDENGINNLYIATFDSTISYIDTTTHYRYYTTYYPTTNYSQSILDYDLSLSKNQIVQLLLNDNKYFMYQKPFDFTKNKDIISNISETEFRKKYTEELIEIEEDNAKEILALEKEKARQDSIASLPLENFINPDSIIIDVNNYVFEIEKETPYKYFYEKNYATSVEDTFVFPNPKIYLTSFYKNYVVNQVDFGVLSESYQKFVFAQPYYFNPGANLFFKLGVNDLFEDYKIVGAFRIGLVSDSYEFLLSLEDLKERLDKQYLFHRQTIVNVTTNESTKRISNELMYLLRYPLNQVSAIKTTLSLRYDKNLTLSTDWVTMVKEPDYSVFASAKAEYIFDNTFDLGLNLYDGFRSKLFAEFYQQVEGNYDNMVVLGCDLRYYEKIHRNLIFASRFAASTSFGTGKLLYYLGGVDNWTTLSFDTLDSKRFDYNVNVNTEQNYIFQAVATNLRGFRQNTRNGNNFALINTEIRWPVIKYFVNRPLNSDFFNNFQVVGFFDIGSAWAGLSPLDPKNAYNKVTVQNGPITVIIDVDRAPVVAGYGVGIRSRLFGYFFRFDWAWGLEGRHVMPRMFYFSLNLDF